MPSVRFVGGPEDGRELALKLSEMLEAVTEGRFPSRHADASGEYRLRRAEKGTLELRWIDQGSSAS